MERLQIYGAALEDEPLAEWAFEPREHLEWARQEARLALARDRMRGLGRSAPSARRLGPFRRQPAARSFHDEN